MNPSNAMDAYMEAIYVLRGEGDHVHASHVADYLGVTRPTVSQTLQKMIRAGLVTTGESKELFLTDDGTHRAEQIVRRHRLLERWLTDELGLDWADAHVEAARLENSVSLLVESRLEEMLGHPTTCPHGNVIPGTGFVQPQGMALAIAPSATPLEVIRIVEVAEEDLELLRFLYRNGFVPGEHLAVEAQNRFEAGIPIRVRGEIITLDADVAKRILVRSIEG